MSLELQDLDALSFCIDLQVCEGMKFSPIWQPLKQAALSFDADLFKLGVPTVYAAYSSGMGFKPFEEGVGLLKDTPWKTASVFACEDQVRFDVSLQPTSLVAFKNSYSIWNEPSIKTFIEESSFRTIILSGVLEGEYGMSKSDWFGCCLTASAMDLANAGYNVLIAQEITQKSFSDYEEEYSPIELRREFHQPAVVMPTKRILEAVGPERNVYGYRKAKAYFKDSCLPK